MKILFVGMIESIHLVRWVGQLKNVEWERFVFPVYGPKPHPNLRDVTLINRGDFMGSFYNRNLKYDHGTLPFFMLNAVNKIIKKQISPLEPAEWPYKLLVSALAHTIRRIKPDIVHSLEFQGAGYLTLAAKQSFNAKFPTWIATNWGSDIYLFGRLADHRERVRAVLENCDYYSCECERDVYLARQHGLRGKTLSVFPNTGGFDLEECNRLRADGSVSDRKLIILKGYQGWAGRSLFGLRALARCAEIIKEKGLSVAIYFAGGQDVKIAAELFSQETGIPVEIIGASSHKDMLNLYGRARIYIGLSISDAISTSLLEAMVMGAFPIQSDTSCATEWIADGQSGLIVPPEDVDIIEVAIRRALLDNALVDNAALLNYETARSRLDENIIIPKVFDFYEQVISGNPER